LKPYLFLIFLIFFGGCASAPSSTQDTAVSRIVGMREEQQRDLSTIQKAQNQNQFLFFWQRISFY
jgi:hypothetical protein